MEQDKDYLQRQNDRSRWTPEELGRLSRLAKSRTSAAQAAKALGRRVGSVRRQARQLGVLLYKS